MKSRLLSTESGFEIILANSVIVVAHLHLATFVFIIFIHWRLIVTLVPCPLHTLWARDILRLILRRFEGGSISIDLCR